jgi:5'-methylthioadenosine phosphorylase
MSMADSPVLGVIGGSGLYNMTGLQDVETVTVDTPFGEPSAPVVFGTLDGKRVAFLARHGIGHNISPSEVNYRANIYAMKKIGVRKVVSISACGSLREDYAPGHIVVPDDIFDFTRGRARSFFGEGLVAHIGVAEPLCGDFSRQVLDALKSAGATVHQGGTLITIEGPRFSTRAESNVFRSWNMAIIGMTASPEVFLAREAELCYTIMAHVTDYDVWHVSEAPVSVEMVIRTLLRNTEVAQNAVQKLVENLDSQDCACQHALSEAIITAPDHIRPETREKLDLLVGKYLAP